MLKTLLNTIKNIGEDCVKDQKAHQKSVNLKVVGHDRFMRLFRADFSVRSVLDLLSSGLLVADGVTCLSSVSPCKRGSAINMVS